MFNTFRVLDLKGGLAYETSFTRTVKNAFIVDSFGIALAED
jgi:hypothetical protein